MWYNLVAENLWVSGRLVALVLMPVALPSALLTEYSLTKNLGSLTEQKRTKPPVIDSLGNNSLFHFAWYQPLISVHVLFLGLGFHHFLVAWMVVGVYCLPCSLSFGKPCAMSRVPKRPGSSITTHLVHCRRWTLSLGVSTFGLAAPYSEALRCLFCPSFWNTIFQLQLPLKKMKLTSEREEQKQHQPRDCKWNRYR